MFGITRAVTRSAGVRPVVAGLRVRGGQVAAIRFNSGGSHAHESESYDSFNSRYRTFFLNVEDTFELQRGLNNCFAYDLVPATEVIEAALKAARKVNDYATAVRILEGVKEKVENKGQYKAYLEELRPVISELGISTKEDLYNL